VLFKPAGVPASQLGEIVLGIDEMEAIRLADLEGLYQEQAAERMNVSRQTFGRIVSEARKKVARALVQGMSLRIQGGEIEMAEQRIFTCLTCGHEWQVPFGTGRPKGCPQCAGTSIRRAKQQRAGGPGADARQDSTRGTDGGSGMGSGKRRSAGGGGGAGRSRGRAGNRAGRGGRGGKR